MFEIGFSELMLIGIVALVVLGPERLPGAARTLGSLVRRARNSWQSLRTDLERELNAEELKRSLHATPVLDAIASARSGIDEVRSDLARGAQDLRTAFDGGPVAPAATPAASPTPAPAVSADAAPSVPSPVVDATVADAPPSARHD